MRFTEGCNVVLPMAILVEFYPKAEIPERDKRLKTNKKDLLKTDFLLVGVLRHTGDVFKV